MSQSLSPHFRTVIAVILVAFLLPAMSLAASEQEAWEALREGRAVLILRHALAPGTGDPSGFELGDCSTQRNLNERGRDQARSWKPFLARHGIDQARVFSSRWCRATHTAEEMGLGKVTAMPSLDSFFQNRGDRQKQTGQTIVKVNALEAGPPIVMVSHQVNITALSGIYPASNEGVILALPLSEDPKVLARVSPDQ